MGSYRLMRSSPGVSRPAIGGVSWRDFCFFVQRCAVSVEERKCIQKPCSIA
jgi:hypothetical protein